MVPHTKSFAALPLCHRQKRDPAIISNNNMIINQLFIIYYIIRSFFLSPVLCDIATFAQRLPLPKVIHGLFTFLQKSVPLIVAKNFYHR